MRPADSPFTHSETTWRAQLALHYELRAERSVLAARRHDGPLVTQKPLYPEGDAVCHSIIVHPPGGIAGGDQLEVNVHAGAGARALLTTPGAAKWYRSAGAWARQHNRVTVEADACVEWLPQETIVFDGALAQLDSRIELAARASYIGWEILCFGRAGSGERFARGRCTLRTSITRAGKPLWLEQGAIDAGGLRMRSPAGLGEATVCGTLIVAAENLHRVNRDECRALGANTGRTAVTRLPGVLVARYLGDSSEAAKHYFAALWMVLRPLVSGRPAVMPRIWST